jgi:hypothetical protein
MSQLWQMLARNYARFDTPLRPNAETLTAIRGVLAVDDPLVVVLGGTPIFGDLARRVWFIDVSADALSLASATSQQRTIQKNWLDAADECAAADLIVGDGSINAVESAAAAAQLLRMLAATRKPGAALALRIFVKHELPPEVFRQRLTSAFDRKQFSEVRFLVYGAVAGADGQTSAAEVDRYIANLRTHLPLESAVLEAYEAAYFSWRGVSAPTAAAVTTKMFFPSRSQMDAMFAAAGLRMSTISAGTFPLAEFTPIYVNVI